MNLYGVQIPRKFITPNFNEMKQFMEIELCMSPVAITSYQIS